MKSPLSVGVVVGQAGELAVADALACDPHVDLRCICDASLHDRPQLRQSNLPGVSRTKRFSDVLEDESIDAIVFAVAPHLRSEHVREALEADKHVLVFGLLASTLAEADELVRVAARRGRHLAAHHVGSARLGVRRLRSMLDRGALGEIHYLEVERSALPGEDAEPSPIWNLAADAVALALDLLGDQPIEAHGRSETHAGLESDVLRASLVFATGISAHLSLSTLDAQSTDRVTVVGGTMTAVVESIRGVEELSLYAGGSESARRVIVDDFSLHAGDVLKPIVPAQDPLRVGCEQFVAAVRTRFEPQTGRDAAAVVAVLEALQRSVGGEAGAASAPDPVNVVRLPLRLG